MSFGLSRWATQVVALFQPCPQEDAQRGDLLGMVGQRLRVRPRVPPRVALDDSAGYLQLFSITL